MTTKIADVFFHPPTNNEYCNYLKKNLEMKSFNISMFNQRFFKCNSNERPLTIIIIKFQFEKKIKMKKCVQCVQHTNGLENFPQTKAYVRSGTKYCIRMSQPDNSHKEGPRGGGGWCGDEWGRRENEELIKVGKREKGRCLGKRERQRKMLAVWGGGGGGKE